MWKKRRNTGKQENKNGQSLNFGFWESSPPPKEGADPAPQKAHSPELEILVLNAFIERISTAEGATEDTGPSTRKETKVLGKRGRDEKTRSPGRIDAFVNAFPRPKTI